ncbi:MAG TPA: hypothetical protein VLQ45_34830, partial [Thermoanaerobaculia bacterium]|nr:hypothetical protein [Thermoanaerobaculia bacterium]
MKGTLTLAVVALAVTGCSSAPTGSANSQVTRAEADIALADRLIAKSAQASPAQREKLLDRAESLLQEVGARDLDAELQLIAVNNLGVLLLERDAPQKAAEVLGRLRGKVNPRSEGGPALFYNLGRALEEAGRPAEALPLYREVLAHERAFTDAADVALRTARSLPGDAAGLAQALALVRLLVDQRNAPAADEAFLQSLADERWAGLPGYQELLTELVRWLDLSGRDPAEFLERVRPVLIRQRPRLEARARDKADSLVGALDASYPLRVSQETPGVESRGWQGESAEAQLFSRFLRRVGDDHFTAGRPDLAAQRYAAAWNLEATYTEAALDLAAVLDREAPELDPSRRLQAALIDRVERDPERLDSDPESRQYLHAVL